MIDIAIAVLAEDDVAAIVEAHRQQRFHRVCRRWKRPCPSMPFFTYCGPSRLARGSRQAGVFEEDDPVAGGELAKPTRRLEFARPSQRALLRHHVAQGLVELPNIIVGVSKNEQLVAAKPAWMSARGGFRSKSRRASVQSATMRPMISARVSVSTIRPCWA